MLEIKVTEPKKSDIFQERNFRKHVFWTGKHFYFNSCFTFVLPMFYPLFYLQWLVNRVSVVIALHLVGFIIGIIFASNKRVRIYSKNLLISSLPYLFVLSYKKVHFFVLPTAFENLGQLLWNYQWRRNMLE